MRYSDEHIDTVYFVPRFHIAEATRSIWVSPGFRGVSLQEYRVAHVNVDPYVRHEMGHPALFDKRLYFDGEQRAREMLLANYAWRHT